MGNEASNDKRKNKRQMIMKTNHAITALLLALAAFNLQNSTAFSQGSLTPPGVPAPTMKSLDQVYAKLDPRTAITNANSTYTITVPGSYYLTTNLTVNSENGININASGVTLDLNGFTISSTTASAAYAGISLNANGSCDLAIVNGHIRSGVTNDGRGAYGGSGFAVGITFDIGHSPTNVLVSKVSVSGVSTYGIYLGTGNATRVEACMVTTTGGVGISASTIKGSLATDCVNAIVGDQMADCRGIGTGNGIIASVTAQNCYGQGSGSYGISTASAQNCYGTNSSTGTGLSATVAQNCFGSSVSGAGITATIANSCWIGHGTTNITYKYNMP
jgi:hypothetical protein